MVADIGIAPQSDPKTPFVIEKAQVKTWIKRKSGDTHKGTFGKAGLLVGSKGMSGAAALSARACLRCGVGLCVPIVPECIYPMVSAAAPEAVYRVYDQAASAGQVAQNCMDSNALLVGCGLSVNSFSKAVCRELVLSYPGPLVLDADGINSLVGHIDVLKRREGVTLLTPHPGEMAGLLRCDVAKVQANRLETAREFARETGAITVLKGASTVIASPDGRVAVSLTGNSGLSKGGSGDVLAGMMVSLLAQGVPGFESACAAVWLHGKAGDLAARRLSVRGMLPSDVIDGLPSLFLENEEQ